MERGAKLSTDNGAEMNLKTVGISALFCIFLIAGCDPRTEQKTVSESEFGKYPIEKYIDYRLNTPYWNLPGVQSEKLALKTGIKELHFVLVKFNDKGLTPGQAHEELLFRTRIMAREMKSAFKKYMPDNFVLFENANYSPGTDNSKAIYKYRLPTMEETDNDKLWAVWIRNSNLYVTSIWIMDTVLEHAYVDAMFELKKLGVPNSYIAFDLALNSYLEQMHKIIQKQ